MAEKKSTRLKIIGALLAFFIVLTVLLAVATVIAVRSNEETPRVIELTARQFAFEPEVIHIKVGEKIILRVHSEDVTHGIYIDGQDINEVINPGEIVDIGPFSFDQPGKYKIRCAVTCGPLHPFMVADIIVEPNYTLYVFISIAIVASIGTLFYLERSRPKYNEKVLGVSLNKEVDLFKARGIGKILSKVAKWRGIHYALILPNLAIFMLLITVGLIGNPTGNLNFAIAVVWILWFAAVEFMILFVGRMWCQLCPMPAFGEWLARRRVYSVKEPRKWFSLGKKWPKKLNNTYIASSFFLGISIIIPWMVTQPVVTALFFMLLIALAFGIHMVFTGRHFCLSVCPAGYIGYNSQASFAHIQARDREMCKKHLAKECMRGGPKGYACPWKLYPGGKESGQYCNFCFECVKSCPMDNMTLKLRMTSKEIVNKKKGFRTDEAWWGFTRFSLAIFYELVFFGSIWFIKDWANLGALFGANISLVHLLAPTSASVFAWFQWAMIVILIAVVVFPAIFYAFSALARRAAGEKKVTRKETFLAFSYALAPYSQFLWVAFAITLIAVNWAYPLSAFLDPAGFGWDPLGTGRFGWNPILPQWIPYLQVVLISIGIALAVDVTYQISRNLFGTHKKAMRSTSVMTVLYIMSGSLMLLMIIG